MAKLYEFILSKSIFIYLILALILAFSISMIENRHSKISHFDKILKSLECAAFTAAISLPILEYWTFLPPSLSLFIGSFIGSIGATGATDLFTTLKKRLEIFSVNPDLNKPTVFIDPENHYNVKHYKRTSSYRTKPIKDEPPMPDDFRE